MTDEFKMSGDVKVPLTVLDALLMVRDSGATNMLNRKAVSALAKQYSPEASRWLFNADDHEFMAALNAMGKILSKEKRR